MDGTAVPRATPARDLSGKFLSRRDEANRLAGVVAHPLAPAALDLDQAPPEAPEPVLVQLQRLFREADRPTKRAFCTWLGEVLTYDQTLAAPEEV